WTRSTASSTSSTASGTPQPTPSSTARSETSASWLFAKAFRFAARWDTSPRTTKTSNPFCTVLTEQDSCLRRPVLDSSPYRTFRLGDPTPPTVGRPHLALLSHHRPVRVQG